MGKEIKVFRTLGIGLIVLALLFSIWGVYILDGTREKTKFMTPIPGDPNENLVYYEWEPTATAPDRGNRVVFLFAGFLSQQTMMFPLMRELTHQGYHVITGDFRGHGESGGEFTMNWTVLLDDFQAIFTDVKARRGDEWNFTHVAVCGHSMGGFAAILIGNKMNEVFTTVAFAPAPYQGYINATNPKNLMIIIGTHDQAFSEEVELALFQKAQPNGEVGKLYGNPLQGTAKKMVVAEWARHENELTDDYCLGQAVWFVEMGFGFMNPGDDYNANQQLRMDLITYGLGLGMIGICILFFMINRIEIKKPENPVLGRLFQTFIGNYFEAHEITPLIEQEDQKLYSPFLDGWLKSFDLFRSDKESELPVIRFVKDWFAVYIPSVFIGLALFMLSLYIIGDVFSNFQIILHGIPGICCLLVIRRNYLRDKQKHKDFKTYLKPLIHQTKRELSLAAFLIGLSFFGVSLFLLLFGYGQSYMFLFPMNKRIFAIFMLMPFIFIMSILQAWGYMYLVLDRMRKIRHGFLISLATILLTKQSWIILMSFILLAMGNQFITIMALLSILDLLATTLFLANYYYNKNFGAIIIWATILSTFVYLGYAGVINGWEILFGEHYNATYWIG